MNPGRTGPSTRRSPLAVALLLAAACADTGDPRGGAPRVVDAARIRGDAEVLAGDAMEGREAGTAGYDRAAGWVAESFESLGLAPAERGGTYEQEIELFQTRLVPESSTIRLLAGESALDLQLGRDYVQPGGFGAPSERLEASLLFAGHGIVAPEYDHDDFAGIDPSGRVLVVLSGAPPHFATDLRAYYSSGEVKRAAAVERGAAGLLTVRTPVDQERTPWERHLARLGRSDMRWIDSSGAPFRGHSELIGSALLAEAAAEQLFELAGRDLGEIFARHAAGRTGSFELGVTARFERGSIQERTISSNVVGLLEGSDARLRGEYVVYTAHLDHLGTGGEGDDATFNGFYDNAVGVAILLEVARQMMALSERPRRSILFVALTAEEKGLLGSSYFAHNPPVPIDSLVANLNVDMPYLGFPVANLEAFGAEHSSLAGCVGRAATDAGLRLTPDSMPEQVRFVRSDQFSFVQRGIPALALKPGASSTDDSVDGAEELRRFLSERYHRPSDESDQPFSAEGAVRFAQTALLTGLCVANDDAPPAWNPGDFFGETFAR